MTFHELSSQLPPSFHCSFLVFHLVSRPASGLSVFYLPAFSSLQPTSWHWVSGRGCLTLELLQPCGLFEILHVSTKCFMGSKTSAEAGSGGNPEGHDPCCWVSLLSPCLCPPPPPCFRSKSAPFHLSQSFGSPICYFKLAYQDISFQQVDQISLKKKSCD